MPTKISTASSADIEVTVWVTTLWSAGSAAYAGTATSADEVTASATNVARRAVRVMVLILGLRQCGRAFRW